MPLELPLSRIRGAFSCQGSSFLILPLFVGSGPGENPGLVLSSSFLPPVAAAAVAAVQQKVRAEPHLRRVSTGFADVEFGHKTSKGTWMVCK